jgi:hypothetical protein
MAESRQKQEWSRTARLIASVVGLFNPNVSEDDFNPFKHARKLGVNDI